MISDHDELTVALELEMWAVPTSQISDFFVGLYRYVTASSHKNADDRFLAGRRATAVPAADASGGLPSTAIDASAPPTVRRRALRRRDATGDGREERDAGARVGYLARHDGWVRLDPAAEKGASVALGCVLV